MSFLLETFHNEPNWPKSLTLAPLLLSSYRGQVEALKVFRDAGWDLSEAAYDGTDAVLAASFQGHVSVLEFLVEQHACELTSKTHQGWSAATIASANGHLEVLRFLHLRGVDIHEKSLDGVTSLIAACAGGHFQCANYLIEAGVEVDATIAIGQLNDLVALMLAGQDIGRSPVVSFIHELRDQARDASEVFTAADFAEASGNHRLAAHLRSL